MFEEIINSGGNISIGNLRINLISMAPLAIFFLYVILRPSRPSGASKVELHTQQMQDVATEANAKFQFRSRPFHKKLLWMSLGMAFRNIFWRRYRESVLYVAGLYETETFKEYGTVTAIPV